MACDGQIYKVRRVLGPLGGATRVGYARAPEADRLTAGGLLASDY